MRPMSPVSRFALAEHDGGTPELLFDGRPIELPVLGRGLAAQFEHAGLFLLLLTEDSPYEEGLYALLLGGDGEVLDTVQLSNPYTPGLLTELHISSSQSVDFGFFGEDRWRLTILKEPKRHLLHPPSSPVQYRPRLGRHLLDLERMQ
jgi:hypothetical protein